MKSKRYLLKNNKYYAISHKIATFPVTKEKQSLNVNSEDKMPKIQKKGPKLDE